MDQNVVGISAGSATARLVQLGASMKAMVVTVYGNVVPR